MGESQHGSKNPNWRGGPITLTCPQCENAFVVVRAHAKYRKFCSNACVGRCNSENRRGELHPNWKGKPITPKRVKVERFCKKCGVAGVKKGAVYHSHCSPRQGQSIRLLRCCDCGVERRKYVVAHREDATRCQACYLKTLAGAGNGRWKGGITPENKRIRASKEYATWRQSVFERDQFTCVLCGQVGGQLNADHIKPFSRFPALRFELSNGRTLCVPCHKATDTYLCGALTYPKAA